jgi:hypothetical protein
MFAAVVLMGWLAIQASAAKKMKPSQEVIDFHRKFDEKKVSSSVSMHLFCK